MGVMIEYLNLKRMTAMHADEIAQAVTDVLYRSGVRAFWCFAPCRLQLPPDAVIQYENLALSLAHLKARL